METVSNCSQCQLSYSNYYVWLVVVITLMDLKD